MSARAFSHEKLTTPRKAKVHKVLHEDGFRKATEASWNKHSSEVQSLDLLTRCKKLNQFLAQGLLGEVDDEVLELLSQSEPGRPAAVQRALAHTLQKPRQSSPQKFELEYGREAAGSPVRQPLRSRITATETAALLELLDEEGAPQASNNTQVSSTSHSEPCATAGLHTTVSTAPAVTAAADEDLDIIGLINQPAAAESIGPIESAVAPVADLRSVLQQLRREQAAQAATCLQSAFRCKQAGQLLDNMRQQAQQVQKQQHNHLVAQQQQQRLSAAGNAQESVSQAWEGYYKCWGPHAASVIQRHWRSYLDKTRSQQLRNAATVLQAYVRGWRCRQSPDNPLPAHKQSMQHRLLQQQLQEQERHYRQAAAVVLQCCVRGWKARRGLQQLLHEAHARAQTHANAEAASAPAADLALCRLLGPVAIANEQVATNTAATLTSEPVASQHAALAHASGDNSNTPASSSSASSGGSSSDVCSQQDSTDSSQQAAGVHRMHMHRKHHKHRQPELHSKEGRQQSEDYDKRTKERCDEDVKSQPVPAGQKQDQQDTTMSSICPLRRPASKDSDANSSNGPLTNADALLARQLLIRSAAETRTATQHGETEMPGYQTGLVGDLVQRIGELSAGENLQATNLAVRVTMAGSSHRGLQDAMMAVKDRRETH